MSILIDAIYEDGVLKPVTEAGFKERHLYKVILEDSPANSTASPLWLGDLLLDPEIKSEIERRITELPDGRRIIRVAGLFSAGFSGLTDEQDPVSKALEELREERARRLDRQWAFDEGDLE